ncbi:sensor domain-containing diguanylate cyclase [Aliamphritea spongicola]|uniref:sensor domain-containing diguanylate cyclase n=1 Tax=Aliamphritea spongicola TaxID=707589 RepID=UPI001FAFA885|nr:GGDEF domain-containing protein [Aliamphritea spongicola]
MMIDTQACLSRHPHPNLDLEKWQTTVDLMAELFDSACGTIVQFRQQEFNAVVASLNEDNFLQRNSSWPWDMKSFCRRIVETGEGLYVENAPCNSEWKDAPPVAEGPVRSYFGMPITWPDGTLFGTICVIDKKLSDYSDTQLKILEQFRNLINADLHMLISYEEIKALAITDELTQVHNRRGLNLLGEQRFKDARRFDQHIGMVYIDIDNLKQLNDTEGHQAGDACITGLANTLQENCRDSDIIARVGGDEFLVMMLTDNEQQIQTFCQRIEHQFSEQLKQNPSFRMNSLSYGYCFTEVVDDTSMEAMIDKADKHMYENKQANKLHRSA